MHPETRTEVKQADLPRESVQFPAKCRCYEPEARGTHRKFYERDTRLPRNCGFKN